ncbi:MAG: hypothetical protein FWE23_00230 [Chitinivibrionia bacterium]|nr:hypothetical protein [Chitinivibrionia bacterium]
MKERFFLCFAVLFLFAACSSGTIDRGSDKRIRVGNNNGIVFRNITSGTNRTRYGFSRIRFASEGTYAIVSIPANEDNVSTYFDAIVTPERRTSNLMLMTYRDSPDFSLLLNGSNENMQMNVTGDQEQVFQIGIRGKFKPYRQENIVLISFTKEHFTDEQEAERTLLQLDTLQRYFLGENTVFVVPYTWRTIRVRIEGGEKDDYAELIKWANDNVFNQAIVRLELAEEEYDCRINLGQNVSGVHRRSIDFLDDEGNIFNPHRSNRIVAANLRFSSLYVWEYQYDDPSVPPWKVDSREKGAFLKRFSYAVAHIMGVSQGDSDYNLMNTNGDGSENNNIDHVHLTFQQWNQLHAKGGGR